MNKKIWLVSFLTFALAQIAFGQQTATVQPPVSTKTEAGYLIGIGDEITGYSGSDNKEFDFVADVDENGKLQVPFSDELIQASCRTANQLRADVIQVLARYLKKPQISVRVTKRRSPPAVIFGEVRTPQQVELTRQARLLDMLSLAGGATELAGGTIQLYHRQQQTCDAPAEDKNLTANSTADSDSLPKIYSLSRLREGRDEYNPLIYPGDKIIVDKAAPVYITGEVNAPQGILLKEGGTTLVDAIAKVNGVRREAKTKDIKIYRLKPNDSDQDNREIISVNYDLIKKGTQKDVLLQPYDIIEVDKAKKSIGQIALELATGASRQALSSTATVLPTVLY